MVSMFTVRSIPPGASRFIMCWKKDKLLTDNVMIVCFRGLLLPCAASLEGHTGDAENDNPYYRDAKLASRLTHVLIRLKIIR